MKRNRYIWAMAAMSACTGILSAQTQYDAARLIDSDLNGTARFVAMGGAMSALGGDISTVSTNPAGTALFRSNEISMSFGVNGDAAKTDFTGTKDNDKSTRMSFDQLGIIFSTEFDNSSSLRYFNYGFNYHKKRNFNKRMSMYGDLLGPSLTDQIAYMTNHDPSGYYNPLPEEDYYQIYDDLKGDYFGSEWSDVSWLSVLGIQGGLIGPEGIDENGNFCYIGIPSSIGSFRSREVGGVNEFDVNLSANINDRFYLGMSISVHDVDYERTSSYSENGYLMNQGTFYTLNNTMLTEGTGIGLKLGMIIRPFEYSGFRFGLAVHTPVCYNLSDRHWASLSSSLDNYWGQTDVAMYDYTLLTPAVYNISLGHTVSNLLAFGAEYEYTDYSSAELQDDYGNPMNNENDVISEDLKGMHTFKVGMEVKVTPDFSLRAGYNYSSAAFRKSAYKWLYPNDTRTDAEYENSLERNNVSLGLGYRFGHFYTDLAYQYSVRDGEFYPFDSGYSGTYPYTNDGLLPATKVKNERNNVLLTLGYKF